MQNNICNLMIDSIPIVASSSLTNEKITMLFHEIIQSWDWDGKQLGRVEFIQEGHLIRACSYERPSISIIPLLDHIKE